MKAWIHPVPKLCLVRETIVCSQTMLDLVFLYYIILYSKEPISDNHFDEVILFLGHLNTFVAHRVAQLTRVILRAY